MKIKVNNVKLYYEEYGRRRECYFLNGKYYDHVYMDILAREFEGNYIKNKNGECKIGCVK